VKLLLKSSHLEPQAVKPQRHRGGRRLGLVEASLLEKHQAPPYWCAKYLSGFTALLLVLLQLQPVVVLLLEGL
jgi:hypothetical protein